MAKSSYEERYCAYIDILGFSDLIGRLRTGSLSFETIRSLLKRIHAPYDPAIIDFEHCDFRAQSISDAVTLSTQPTIAGLGMLIAAIRQLSVALLHEGYFVRGALCKGLLYHDESTVFGDALIKAYTLEQEVVRFPRIMLTKDVVDDAMASAKRDEFQEHIRQAEDGPYFVHILWKLWMLLDLIHRHDYENEEPDLTFYAHIRQMIERKFWESVDTPRHFEKVQWFCRYWNGSIINIRTSVGRISGPGLDPLGGVRLSGGFS
jgi:hypothetical protein